jgi:hypothetical protein
MKIVYITESAEETERLGIEIGKRAVYGDVIALRGETWLRQNRIDPRNRRRTRSNRGDHKPHLQSNGDT